MFEWHLWSRRKTTPACFSPTASCFIFALALPLLSLWSLTHNIVLYVSSCHLCYRAEHLNPLKILSPSSNIWRAQKPIPPLCAWIPQARTHACTHTPHWGKHATHCCIRAACSACNQHLVSTPASDVKAIFLTHSQAEWENAKHQKWRLLIPFNLIYFV